MRIAWWGQFRRLPPFLDSERPRIWRTALFVVLFMVSAFTVMGLAMRVGALLGALIDLRFFEHDAPDFWLLYHARLAGNIWGEDLGVVAATLTSFIPFAAQIAVVVLLLKYLYRKPIRNWVTTAPRFRWGLFLVGLVFYGVIYSAGLVLAGALTAKGYSPAMGWTHGKAENIAIFLTSTLVMVSAMASAEEFVFRGWLQKEIAAYIPNLYVVLVISSVAFALLHREMAPYRLLQLFLGGICLGWAALRTNGIEFGCGLHAAWNMALQLFVQNHAVPVLFNPATPTTLTLTGGIPWSPQEWAVLIALPLAGIMLTEGVVRHQTLRALLGVETTT